MNPEGIETMKSDSRFVRGAPYKFTTNSGDTFVGYVGGIQRNKLMIQVVMSEAEIVNVEPMMVCRGKFDGLLGMAFREFAHVVGSDDRSELLQWGQLKTETSMLGKLTEKPDLEPFVYVKASVDYSYHPEDCNCGGCPPDKIAGVWRYGSR